MYFTIVDSVFIVVLHLRNSDDLWKAATLQANQRTFYKLEEKLKETNSRNRALKELLYFK